MLHDNQEGRKMFEIDKRMLYILPSVLALAISITILLFEFGNHIVDLKNICYTIYVNAPENETEDECIESIKEVLVEEDIQGFTVMKNALGGYRDNNNNLATSESYQIILMDISRSDAETVAKDVQLKLGTAVMMEAFRVDVEHLDIIY